MAKNNKEGHGNKGNKHSQKGKEKASSTIICRVEPSLKTAVVKQAIRDPTSNNQCEWVIKVLTDALDDDLRVN